MNCSKCNSSDTVQVKNTTICKKCGYVNSYTIVTSLDVDEDVNKMARNIAKELEDENKMLWDVLKKKD